VILNETLSLPRIREPKIKFLYRIEPMPANRRDLRRRLFNLASEQAGYFTAAQAKEVGYSYQAQAHHVGTGNWIRIERGLFRLTEWLPDVHDDLVRWSLWSHGRGVISHETALAVHAIGEFESVRVHLTVPPGFTMRDDDVVLHYLALADEDVQQRTGFRVTTPARSLIDVAATAPDEAQLARAVEDARGRGLVSVRLLRSRAETIDSHAALYLERALHRADA
jgi:predicted transcriptional regulator of viral defense system